MFMEEIVSNDGMTKIDQDKLPIEVFPKLREHVRDPKVETIPCAAHRGSPSFVCSDHMLWLAAH